MAIRPTFRNVSYGVVMIRLFHRFSQEINPDRAIHNSTQYFLHEMFSYIFVLHYQPLDELEQIFKNLQDSRRK